jgi:hypothetical protein
MHLFHVAVAAHQEYRKTFNPSESGPSPAQKYIKLAKAPLGMTNTHMKDFFDLWVLLHDTTLDDAELLRAVEATFARRQTAVPSNQPIGLSDVFANDATKQLQWRAFLKKNKLEPVDLGDVVRTIRERGLQFGFTGT